MPVPVKIKTESQSTQEVASMQPKVMTEQPNKAAASLAASVQEGPGETTSNSPSTVKMAAKNVDLFYGPKQALKKVEATFSERSITALIGPSGCGKSTFLRCLNR